MRPKFLLFFVLIAGFASCDFKPLPPSLWLTGKNKKEFQKVFDYYQHPADSLKLKAAKFLVEHLGNHFYYQTKNQDEIDNYFKQVNNELFINYPQKTRLYEMLRRELFTKNISEKIADGSLPKPAYRKIPDSNTIKAEFLIENIEYAFKAWNLPWSKSYSFDEFCKYILPYRYGNEVPESWRKTIFEKYRWVVDSLNHSENPIEAASFLSNLFNYDLTYATVLTKNGFKLKITNHLNANVFSNCNEQAGLGTCFMRAMGIPATIVNIPQWGHFSGGHQMVGMLDHKGSWHFFNFGESGPDSEQKMAPPKTFFYRFDNMKRFMPVQEDASGKLIRTVNLEIITNANPEDEVYLCVFGGFNWIPVFKGKNLHSKTIFQDVGYRSKMYLAAAKKRGKLTPVSPVFLTDTIGNITYFKPDYSDLNSAILTRKYPGLQSNAHRIEALIGGEFTTAKNRDFKNEKLLYKIDNILDYNNNIIRVTKTEGNFFRYIFPAKADTIFDGPAEISFYTMRNNKPVKIEGNYFGSNQLSEEHINLMTDNNMLSYVEVWDCNTDLNIETGRYILRKKQQAIWIGMETDSITSVTHVGICPRNDKNGIYPGMHYELLYWDDSWISLGVKIAENNFVEFSGIPKNAVFWLRNLDEGKEERMFILKEGEQIWW